MWSEEKREAQTVGYIESGYLGRHFVRVVESLLRLVAFFFRTRSGEDVSFRKGTNICLPDEGVADELGDGRCGCGEGRGVVKFKLCAELEFETDDGDAERSGYLESPFGFECEEGIGMA